MTIVNSLFNMARDTQPFSVIERALRFVGEPLVASGFSRATWLGTSSAAALAQHLQDAEAEVLCDLPKLNKVSANIAVTAGTAVLATPTDLRINEIDDLRWSDVLTPQYDQQGLMICSPRDMDLACPGWRSTIATTYQSDWPMYAVIDDENGTTTGKIILVGTPTTDRTLQIVYRAKGTTYTSANLSTAGIYVLIPTDCVEILAWKLAETLGMIKFTTDPKRSERLRLQYERKRDWWNERLPMPPVITRNARFTDAGFPAMQNRFCDQDW